MMRFEDEGEHSPTYVAHTSIDQRWLEHYGGSTTARKQLG